MEWTPPFPGHRGPGNEPLDLQPPQPMTHSGWRNPMCFTQLLHTLRARPLQGSEKLAIRDGNWVFHVFVTRF